MKTRLTPSGQPVQGTHIELQHDDLSWSAFKVVGKLYGQGGNADLVGLIVEGFEGRFRINWPTPYWRSCR